ncbi:WD repeat-containing protein 36 [Schistocerca piceifrons]|uniref:WD repeat-containing protein 36 n=1 Tax=Schistocerca piceifrons TaxID=274613 RepID=UPI001F5E52EF|nr:WD repeat-containing protein 36 [Schistocerca piceifrons]
MVSTTATVTQTRRAGSRIFAPARALGLVSNHVPHALRYIRSRKEHLVVTCIGKAFHTYGLSHLALLSTSPQHAEDISCLAADTYHVYTAAGSQIFAWRRGAELQHTYGQPGGPDVKLLLPFGPHLVAVDSRGVLRVWDIKAEDVYTELSFECSLFEPSALVHPSTYLNKILLGSRQGQMQLWNIHKGALIHTFKGWRSPVTVLAQSPAVDVVAVGLEDGRIVLHNLRFDESIATLVQDWGPVTAVAFRTDSSPAARPLMLSAAPSGHVVLWDLDKRRACGQLTSGHAGAVVGMSCLPGEPVLVTNSVDNSLKVWLMSDGDSGEPPRLLRMREGHSGTPNCVRFHGTVDSRNLVTAGSDSTLRIFSTINETFNKSLGRASYNRKASKKRKGGIAEDPLIMPPITSFASETTREKEWDGIAAVHLGVPFVTTWSYDKLRMGDHKLMHERFNNFKGDRSLSNSYATCVCITRCGNFAVVGMSSGHVDRFNTQSGIHRDTYGTPTAHTGAVRGVATDTLNQVTVTVGADSMLRFWRFKCKGTKPLSKVDLDERPLFLRTHHESSLVAIALEDFSVSVADTESRSVVRKLAGHPGAQITDATFSPDSRWLVTAGTDCRIRTWDLPSGKLVDSFQTDSACTSISFSAVGDLLATTHVDYMGVFLWANRALFKHIALHPLDPLEDSEAEALISLPVSAPDEGANIGAEDLDAPDGDEDGEDTERPQSPDQISEGLATLSGVAAVRWQNLLMLDVIRKRNKPREPPKTVKSAPFFLPTVPSLSGEVQFDVESEKQTEKGKELDSSRALVPSSLTVFGKLLRDAGEEGADPTPALEKLRQLGPAALEVEVLSLAPEGGGSISLMATFIKLLTDAMRNGKDFELAQAHFALFLKHHGDRTASEPRLRALLPTVAEVQAAGWQRLQDRLMACLAIVSFFRTS